jgi:hypothetical protein
MGRDAAKARAGGGQNHAPHPRVLDAGDLLSDDAAE